jgi:glyoxylase-like metal-dependent hydrolase (beta-lactamase superfamily II)
MIHTAAAASSLNVTFPATQSKGFLNIRVYNADAKSFNVTSTLVYGETEAIVIDAGFTRADALRIAANVLDSGKKLTTIYVSQADPDYYFGVEWLKQIFPDADVVTTPAVLKVMQEKMPAKLQFWAPKMGANAPSKPHLPLAMEAVSLKVDGQAVEIRGTSGPLAHRPYAWIPSVKAIAGTIGVFGNMHVWTADAAKVDARTAWIQQLDEMAALKPELVVSGHMSSGTAMDASAIVFTKDYLRIFEKNLGAHKNSADLIKAMQTSYPNINDGAMSLDIGAKVNTGEMKW